MTELLLGRGAGRAGGNNAGDLVPAALCVVSWFSWECRVVRPEVTTILDPSLHQQQTNFFCFLTRNLITSDLVMPY